MKAIEARPMPIPPSPSEWWSRSLPRLTLPAPPASVSSPPAVADFEEAFFVVMDEVTVSRLLGTAVDELEAFESEPGGERDALRAEDDGSPEATLASLANRVAELAERLERVEATQSRRPGDRQTLSDPDDLPAEVGTAQAAKILGVSKDTVLAYRAKGILPFRNLAPPGSTKPAYMFPLAAVVKLRTTYEEEQPPFRVQAEPSRRRVKGRQKYKHLDLDD
jgi:hypothetical protein